MNNYLIMKIPWLTDYLYHFLNINIALTTLSFFSKYMTKHKNQFVLSRWWLWNLSLSEIKLDFTGNYLIIDTRLITGNMNLL